MTSLQIISKVLNTGDYSIITDNLLTEEFFVGYESEFNFVMDHIRDYGVAPDKATFAAKFTEFQFVEVAEPNDYLVDAIREEHLYHKSVPIIQRAAELLKDDSNAAAEFLIGAMKDIQPQYKLGGVDIIKRAKERLDQYVDKRDNRDKWFFTTGFEELDSVVRIQRGEELFVIMARTNQGKSWMLEKMMTHIWSIGYNVGYISPEMGASSIGYRFDTLNQHFSNTALMKGTNDLDVDEYREYLDELAKNENKFVVAEPKDFQKKITVSKVRNWVKQNNLDVVAIDGITYMSDERYHRGDTRTISLTNISEDLMELSNELHIPVFVVVQANRNGVVEKGSSDVPGLESVRDSDGIAHNASTVLSINQKEPGVLSMVVNKQRFGIVGTKLLYQWDINTGDFNYLPGEDSDVEKEEVAHERPKYNDKTNVF